MAKFYALVAAMAASAMAANAPNANEDVNDNLANWEANYQRCGPVDEFTANGLQSSMEIQSLVFNERDMSDFCSDLLCRYDHDIQVWVDNENSLWVRKDWEYDFNQGGDINSGSCNMQLN